MRLAGIDIGTNTIRLLIADFDENRRFREIHSDRRITRLGENLVRTGKLSESAMERTFDVLRRYRLLCRDYRVQRVIGVATSAVRDSSNGRRFVKKIREELELPVRVLRGTEEASLTLLGVVSDWNSPRDMSRPVLMMDIGGGSTEFVLYHRTGDRESSWEGDIPYRVSADLGVVLLTEKYVSSDPISRGDFESLSRAVESKVRELAPPIMPGDTIMVGTAGTVTTLAAVDLGLKKYRPEAVHHSILKKNTVDEWLMLFVSMSSRERLSIPGLEPGREDIIVAGTLIVQKAMEEFRFDEMLVSDYGLREGAVLSLYDEITLKPPQ
jgi:exopolyphosphatase/guanosine-5'-triphosphate,3'-diphosphate pyrophosphatase